MSDLIVKAPGDPATRGDPACGGGPASRGGRPVTPGEPDPARLNVPPPIAALFEAFPDPVMVLDSERRVVRANQQLLDLLGERSADAILGARPGDVFHCCHAEESCGGCGTTPHCDYCGAFTADVAARRSGEPVVALCRFLARSGSGLVAYDLRVRATPLDLPWVDGVLTILAFRDVSDEHRRRALEGIFFHDLLDSMGALRALLDILPQADGEELAALHASAARLLDETLEEIQSHRDLAAAERGLLATTRRGVEIAPLLERLIFRFSRHPLARGRVIAPPRVSGRPALTTDETLLSRVLANLVKNALEASSPGETISISCRNGDVAVFEVAGQAVMPPEVKAQVFKRSFSTKPGAGRGLGTFSVKLLVENYLRGTVDFSSSPGAGTVFTVAIPDLDE